MRSARSTCGRSARGGAGGRLHRQVRDQVHRGRRRRSYRIERAHELDRLRCREHARRLITGAWHAGAQGCDAKRMRRWAHQFGFGGHCFTKSRRFSTTFKALREARAGHAAARRPQSRPPRKVTTT